MRLTALTICLFFLISSSRGQASIKGKVSDSSEKKFLPNSSVLLLQKTDSIMVAFVRANQQGEFRLNLVKPGSYLIVISYPKYADYVDELQIKDSTETDLHNINMTLRSQLLQAVVVNATGSIRIKGDTTEYKADSFKVQAGATVEDLLKKLPGITVDKNGQITAQGEKVKKVLVDGEEFFGDDPTLVTQNLRADMVDKVQVYDKKSDQANFTGIDDGVRDKTINLKIKEDKKNGYFGKLDAGIGTDGYYNYQAMVNMFKKKKKFSFYGIASNTGKTGLNWRENDNYGQSSSNNVEYDESQGGFTWSGLGEDDLGGWNGQYDGHGLPSVLTAGLHYNDKWDDDRQSMNLNYKILELDITGNNQTNSQTILPDTTYYTNAKEVFSNQILRNRLNGMYEIKFDSTSSIKLNLDGGTDHKLTNKQNYSEARSLDSALINQITGNQSSDAMYNTFNSNLIWRKKLAKKGRTISINMREAYKNDNGTGYLFSENDFYSGALSPKQVIDQYKTFDNKNLMIDGRIAYTEPLSRYSTIAVNYGINVDNNSSNRNSYNKGAGGKYDITDSLYSNDYLFNVFTQRTGLTYNYIKKKLRMNIGTDIGFTKYKQENAVNDSVSNRNFVNWYPSVNLAYNFSQQTRISFEYRGSTKQPTMQEIQPIANNLDPINIYVGNPTLKPQFGNNLNLWFNSYSVMSERGIFAGINATFTADAITSRNYTDSFGRTLIQAINVNGNYNVNFWMDYNFKWKKPGINIDFNPNISTNRYENIVNGQNNITLSNTYGMGVYLNKSKEKKYGISLSGSWNYTHGVSSIQTFIQTDYYTINIHPDIDVFLPLKFQVHTDCDFYIREKTTAFNDNTNVAIWNAWIGKKLMKNENLLVKISANDILNMNIGWARNVNTNIVSQNTWSTIQRFYMVSVVWNFNKAGTPAPKND
jgi:hypothetical protein